MLAQRLHHAGHLAGPLADGAVDADDAGVLLVDDGVQRDGRLARAAVANDQLALAAADGDHGVDGLDAGLHRLVHRLAQHDARRDHVDEAARLRLDLAAAVQRVAERVHNAAQVASPTPRSRTRPVRRTASPSCS
jgi:hypothetical protein